MKPPLVALGELWVLSLSEFDSCSLEYREGIHQFSLLSRAPIWTALLGWAINLVFTLLL